MFDIKKFMAMTPFNGTPEECIESPLHSHFANHDNYTASKWEHYLSIYTRLLAPFLLLGKPISLMEIGILNGGSLEIWQKFLPAGSHITGIDIDVNCKKIKYNEYINILLGDISKGELINDELKDATFDVIIDDASHVCTSVVANFINTFDKLNLGGIYVIEDCHTSYWKEWGGALHMEGSTVEYFKRLLDSLNYTYFKDTAELNDSERIFYKKYQQQIASISFYDSVIVIEKYTKLRNEPFRNYVFGNQGEVISKNFLLDYGHLEYKVDTKFEKFYRD